MTRATEVVYTLTGTKVRETDKAILFRADSINDVPLDKSKQEWFPLSQIRKMFHDKNVSGSDYIIVSEWILSQKGML